MSAAGREWCHTLEEGGVPSWERVVSASGGEFCHTLEEGGVPCWGRVVSASGRGWGEVVEVLNLDTLGM